MKKKILVIGSGGREHALAWKLSQSAKVSKIYVASGNGGTHSLAENISISPTDISNLVTFTLKNKIDFTVVGMDDSLALGIVDEFQKHDLKIWGPTKAAARIETSKKFAKDLMKRQNIPTAEFQSFNKLTDALEYIKQKGFPLVLKVDGLALGKGVKICRTLDDAMTFLNQVFVDRIFGDAGNEVIVEEFLEGQEISFHAFCDGKNFQLLPTSQDHKAIFDDDKGPNTGGMGTIAPVPWEEQSLIYKVTDEIIKPILRGLEKNGSPFRGLLYPGIINTENGPKVLEFNARFGDPETQSYMRVLKTDLMDIIEATVRGKLDQINIEWKPCYACCIVLASGGYPGDYKKGFAIHGIEAAEKLPDIVVFHAGTKYVNGKLLTNGGRVLGVTATGETLQSALNKAYEAVKLIHFEGIQYRKDIGQKSLKLITNF